MRRFGRMPRRESGGSAMTMRLTFTANAAAVIAVSLALLILGSAAADAGGPIPGSQTYNLQQDQAQALSKLLRDYLQAASQPGANPQELLAAYKNNAQAIRQGFLNSDQRGQMIADLVLKHAKLDENGDPVIDKKTGKIVSDIENTGSAPKDVRADVDLNAKTPEAAQDAIDGWQAGTHVLEGPDGKSLSSIDWNNPPYKVVDRTTDTTLWLPCKTQACLDAKAADTDAWTTEGGLQGTGNSGRVRDPYGYYLDNEKKLLHAEDAIQKFMSGEEADMTLADALKTVAKSLNKANQLAGLPDDTGVLAQASDLQNYANAYEAGIAELQDPRGYNQSILDWLEKAKAQMSKAKDALYRLGQVTELARSSAEKSLLNSNPADPNNFDQNAEGAARSADQRARVADSNATAEGVNQEMGGIGAESPAEGLGGAGPLELPSGGPYRPLPTPYSGFGPQQVPNLKPPPGPEAPPPQMSATGEPAISNLEAAVPPGAMTAVKTGAAIQVTVCASMVFETGNGSYTNCFTEAAKSMPMNALLGAVAAASPWGAALVAVYTVGSLVKGAPDIGTALGEASTDEQKIVKTAQILAPVNSAIQSCNFGAALLIAERIQQQPGFAKLFPNLPALINRLQSYVDAAKSIDNLLAQANAATDPIERQAYLATAKDAAGENKCLKARLPSVTAPTSEATNDGSSTPPTKNSADQHGSADQIDYY